MRRLHASVIVAVTLLAGCAGVPLSGGNSARDAQAPRIAPQAAAATVAPGRTTKNDVASTLGQAIVVRFDSGNEVWVYRWPGRDETTRGATELVVLFGADGVAKKARLRPAYT